MMATWITAEQLPVRGVREPGEGMPISGGGRNERPVDGVHLEAVLHVDILRDVVRIVVIQEIILQRPAEYQQGSQKQNGANNGRTGVAGRFHCANVWPFLAAITSAICRRSSGRRSFVEAK